LCVPAAEGMHGERKDSEGFKAFEPEGLGFAERNFKRLKSERNGRFFRGLLSVIILVLRRSERQDLTTVRELLNGSGECL